MPYYRLNTLEFIGDETKIAKALESIKGNHISGRQYIDFGKIILKNFVPKVILRL